MPLATLKNTVSMRHKLLMKLEFSNSDVRRYKSDQALNRFIMVTYSYSFVNHFRTSYCRSIFPLSPGIL